MVGHDVKNITDDVLTGQSCYWNHASNHGDGWMAAAAAGSCTQVGKYFMDLCPNFHVLAWFMMSHQPRVGNPEWCPYLC
jgi:hypothetical protein